MERIINALGLEEDSKQHDTPANKTLNKDKDRLK